MYLLKQTSKKADKTQTTNERKEKSKRQLKRAKQEKNESSLDKTNQIFSATELTKTLFLNKNLTLFSCNKPKKSEYFFGKFAVAKRIDFEIVFNFEIIFFFKRLYKRVGTQGFCTERKRCD